MDTEKLVLAMRHFRNMEAQRTSAPSYLEVCKRLDLTLDERDVMGRLTGQSEDTIQIAHRNKSYGS